MLAAAPVSPQEAKTVAAKGAGPTIGGCPVFPADNVWNTRVDKLKVDAHSNAYVAKIGVDKTLHPDFGTNPVNGIPYSLIHSTQKRVKVTFEYRDDSDLWQLPRYRRTRRSKVASLISRVTGTFFWSTRTGASCLSCSM